jgi:excisionase family DNA binding protein
MSAVLEPIHASAQEEPDLKLLDDVLQPEHLHLALLIGPDGEKIPIPESAYQVLRDAVHELHAGRAISLVPIPHELSTQQAADLLNVSRPYLTKLLKQGEIAYHPVGTHRRIYYKDLMEYKHERDNLRRQKLRELTQLSQKEGFYDE